MPYRLATRLSYPKLFHRLPAALVLLALSADCTQADLFTYVYTGLPYGSNAGEDGPYDPSMQLTASFSIDTPHARNLSASMSANHVVDRFARVLVGDSPIPPLVNAIGSTMNDGLQEWSLATFPVRMGGPTNYTTSFRTDSFGNIVFWNLNWRLGRSVDDANGPPSAVHAAGSRVFEYPDPANLTAFRPINTNTEALFSAPLPISSNDVELRYARTLSLSEHYPWSREISPGESTAPFVLALDDGNDFDGVFGKKETLITPTRTAFGGDDAIGTIEQSDGQAIITRTDGSSFIVQNGIPVFEGDVIETFDTGVVDIDFVDGTEFQVTEDAVLNIDEYVFDPATVDGTTDFSVLKGIFVFTSGLIGREQPDDVEADRPQGSLGIRGSLEDVFAIDPDTGEFVEVEYASVDTNAIFEAGSPVTLYTAIDVPEDAFQLSFDFAFFDDPTATIEVMLGDSVVGTVRAENYELGEYGLAEFFLSNADTTEVAELAFTYNGETGSQAFFDNVAITADGYNDIPNGDFEQFDNGWFVRGDGQILLGASTFHVVPEPSSISAVAMVALGFRLRRRTHRA